MEGGVKKVKITGQAAESFMKGNKTRRRSPRGVPLKQEGGVIFSPAEVSAPTILAPPVLTVPSTVSTPAVIAAPVVQVGAAKKEVKVILDKKKPKKLVLSAPKNIVKLTSGSSEAVPDVKKRNAKTHKISRRIRVSVDGLNKRVHRAKTIKKESQKMSIEQLKKGLIAAGLIKEGSKAPEHILRQMYSDYQVMNQRAL